MTAVDPSAAPIGAWLGVLGQTGFGAWAGLKRIGELKEGYTVFISAAAGAVGSAAGRMASLLGAKRVVGSAGGATKVAQLVSDLGYDDAFDYRTEDPLDAVPRMTPDLCGPSASVGTRFDVEVTERILARSEFRVSVAA